jgi:hypothetical protein
MLAKGATTVADAALRANLPKIFRANKIKL